MLMTSNVFSIFNFNFDCIEAKFYKIKINSYGVYVVKKKEEMNIFYIFKKRMCQ